MPPNYFVSVVNDCWVYSETRWSIIFSLTTLQEKYPTHTDLMNLQPLDLWVLYEQHVALKANVNNFNPIQTFTLINFIYQMTMVCGMSNCQWEVGVCRNFVELIVFKISKWTLCVSMPKWIGCILEVVGHWTHLFQQERWDMMFIKWKQRTSVRSVGLFALDEIWENEI